MLTPNDLEFIKQRGMDPATVNAQLKSFATGFPYLKLQSTATVGNGIIALDHAQEEQAIEAWNQYLAHGGEVYKFVPASGAASRMFKALFAFVNGTDPQPKGDVATLIENLDRLAFIGQLDDTLRNQYGLDSRQMRQQGRYQDIIRAIIAPEGMNYGQLPKALLTFHRHGDVTRTAMEEQLAEGAQTASAGGKVNLHFTVSAAHRNLFAKKLEQVVPDLEKHYGVKYNISLSEQKPSTDTIAVNPDNTVFRGDDGNPVFRPGGHGALIQNLNDIDSAVVFIKNIDNVVPDTLREPTIRYKKILAGVLVQAQATIARYVNMLRTGNYTIDDLRDMIKFMHATLNVRHESMKTMEDAELANWLLAKLNRPVRVCGMVRNEGEPGGGPYIAYDADGSTSPQILESSQIDLNNPVYSEMMATATHFNPVDLVCYIKDAEGKKFNLPDFIDPQTGFISEKSAGGRELRALELPGLWNGAMSNWNTIFVEVPSVTFNPVKTVNDLLRPSHQ